MKFEREWLKEELDLFIDVKIVDTNRWSIHKTGVFEHEGKHYRASWSQGATEYQDEYPFDNEGPMVECPEVHQVQRIIQVWEPVAA